MTSYKIYQKPGDWTGTTRQKTVIDLSYHSGFRDDENELVIEDDICFFHLELYECDDYTGEIGKRVASTLLSVHSVDMLIEALQKAREHHLSQKGIWEENGKTWLSSDRGPHPGPTEKQNEIYLLPWELIFSTDNHKCSTNGVH